MSFAFSFRFFLH